jgi:hypothetical protein
LDRSVIAVPPFSTQRMIVASVLARDPKFGTYPFALFARFTFW